MAIVKQVRALIDVFDSEGKITGHELEYFAVYEADGPDDPMTALFTPKMMREPISAEAAAKIRGTAADASAVENKALHGQIAEMQKSAEAITQASAEASANHENALEQAEARVGEAQAEAKKLSQLIAQVKAILT